MKIIRRGYSNQICYDCKKSNVVAVKSIKFVKMIRIAKVTGVARTCQKCQESIAFVLVT